MAPTPSNAHRVRQDPALPRASETSRSAIKKPSKSIACRRCHSRKVKCSGGQPCTNCRQADLENECTYPDRDRQITLSEKYLQEIIDENRRLRSSSGTANSNTETSTLDPSSTSANSQLAIEADTAEDEAAVQNPLLESRPWFIPVASLNMPIHIGEAADAAFATRLRQTITNESAAHFPRMSYVSDEYIIQLAETECPWPNAARARFLVKAALETICRYYHMVLRSETLELLEKNIRDFSSCNRIEVSKLYVLFALGEIYSTKMAAVDESRYPGLAYFARGRRMITVPAERPNLATMEVCLLLSIYSFALNRRHSAYSFASSAVRLAVTLGLHLNVPGHQLRDQKVREHRNRLFWTAYTLDRSWAIKLGHPVSIQDEDIHVDPPAAVPVGLANFAHIEDFCDHQYMLHSIGLARLAERIISLLYSRRKQQVHFAQRVQAVLKDLTKWLDSLPDHLRLDNDASSSPHQKQLMYLHLRFNQCVITATRPVLLVVLRNRLHPRRQPASPTDRSLTITITDNARAIADTCIRCARHSSRLLTNAWVDGSFAIFDYFNTQFLFSSASILAVSSLMGTADSAEDGDKFQVAVELIDQLCQSGSFGAREFALHAGAIRSTIEEAAVVKRGGMEGPGVLGSAGDQEQGGGGGGGGGGGEQGVSSFGDDGGITAGMALAEPSLQEFLAQSDFDLQLLDVPTFLGSEDPYGPELWGTGWSPAGL